MTKLVTNNFKVNAALQLRESITETDGNDYYIFAGQHNPWDNDASPPDVTASQFGEYYNIYNNMVFGKKVTESDVLHAVRRVNWTSGTVYTQYDDRADITANSYYVVVDDVDGQRSYFKCLNNNKGAASTQQPSINDLGGAVGASNYTSIYQTTGDGYVWKYMGGVTDSVFEQFATSDYSPVQINANVVTNAVDGSIDTVIINDGGAEYNRYQTGYFREVAFGGDQTKFVLATEANANNDFYTDCDIYIADTGEVRAILDYQVIAANTSKPTSSLEYNGYKLITIDSAFTVLPELSYQYQILPQVTVTGDGANAIGRAVVNTSANTIDQVIMVNRGSGYSFAEVSVTGTSGGSGEASANVRAIISPPGGHGSDVYNELDASQLIFSIKFANTENDTISVSNDFRTVGILKDPLFANVKMTFTDANGTDFTDGYFVKGGTSGATGEVSDNTNSGFLVIKDVAGTFEASETVTEYTDNTFTTGSGITGTLNTAQSQGQSTSGYLAGTFSQTTKVTFSGGFTSPELSGIFEEDDQVKNDQDGVITANGYVQEAIGTHGTMTTVALTNVQGTWQETYDIELVDASGDRIPIATVDGVINPDLKKNSGEVLYIENVQPIERAADQTETVNLVIKF